MENVSMFNSHMSYNFTGVSVQNVLWIAILSAFISVEMITWFYRSGFMFHLSFPCLSFGMVYYEKEQSIMIKL